MLWKIAQLAIAAPRRVVALAVLLFVGAAIFGVPVANKLSAGGFGDPASESARASRLLMDKFGRSDQQMLITVTAADGARSETAGRVGADIVAGLQRSPHVVNVASPWTAPPAAAATLVGTDGRTGLIVADLRGGESNAQKYAQALADELVHDRDGVTVRAGGMAMAYAQVNSQSERDLVVMEAIAIPLSFVVLVWVFGGVLAAALPVAVGLIAIVGSMTILRLITFSSEVSIFALNLSTAMGLALAIDYTLLIISRYRDEVAEDTVPAEALVRTMLTAGRTVTFSAVTVALSMAVMVVFPSFFLKSFAYAGVATVAFAAIAALVITPAAITLLGSRLDSLDIRRLASRRQREATPVEQQFWYRSTKRVMRHATPIGLIVAALLVLLGAPFLGVRWGYSDDRLLPRSASARQVGEQLRRDFATDFMTTVQVVVPDARGLEPTTLDRYAGDLSQIPDISAVNGPTGTFVGGRHTGPPSAPTGIADGSAFFTLASSAALGSPASNAQLDRIHAIAGPAGRPVLITGQAQFNRDSVKAITSRLPLVLGLIAAVSLILLFLLTGSVLMPLKALILNVLSLTATFGALVWIFQDGHLGALGTTATGTLIANMPVLLFCIAFGLSMDYEVFLVSRIREYWLQSDQTRESNDESTALGVARTGRVITAAALVMAISFAALTASQVAFMRMFGLGLTIAVLMDATVIRTVLVPAFMHLLGRTNWWSPKPLAALHNRIGISESVRADEFAAAD